MSLNERVASSNLSPQEKLIMHLLAGSMDCPSVDELVDCLMSEPYGLDDFEAYQALESLKQRGLLELSHFSHNKLEVAVNAHITFAHDWVLKL